MNIRQIPQLNDVIFFDVDGVLTNLTQNKADADLLFLLSALIKNNFFVVLNSGRSMSWLKEVIWNPLYDLNVQNKNLNITNFFVIGEKGGVWHNFNKPLLADFSILIDESLKIPIELDVMVKNLLKSEFSETMFFDASKQVIVTLEKKPTVSIEDFQNAQKIMAFKLKRILKKLQLESSIEVDLTTIAVDIQNVLLGKGYGVKKILDYLNQQNTAVNQFFTIGDSSSDFEMPEFLSQMNKPVLHVHVGDSQSLSKTNFPVFTTNSKYALGTKEFFEPLFRKFET